MGPPNPPPPFGATPGLLPSGWPPLDAALDGGWPLGELCEITGCGRTSLALAAVRQAQSAGQPVVWVDGGGAFCPATAGVDLPALTLVRPVTGARSASEAALLAADLLLRSRAFGLLVLDLPEARRGAQPGARRGARAPSLATWFRLARQAAEARSVLLLLGFAERTSAGSAAALTLRARWRHRAAAAWEPLPPPALEVELLRRRGAGAGSVVLIAPPHAALQSRP